MKMPLPRPVGEIVDLFSILAHFTFTDPPKPVECHRCSKPFSDGNGVTRGLAASHSKSPFLCRALKSTFSILDANIFCQKCYAPYVKYLDALEDTPNECIPIEQFVEEQDSKNPHAEEDKLRCRNDTSSTLVIASPMVPKTPDIPNPPCNDAKESPKTAEGDSSGIRRPIAPFPHIAGGMRSIAQLGTLIATDVPIECRDDESLESTLRATSRPPSPSLWERFRSSHLYVGAGIVRAAGIGMHMAISPASESEGSTPRPESPSPSMMSGITLRDSASNR